MNFYARFTRPRHSLVLKDGAEKTGLPRPHRNREINFWFVFYFSKI